MERVLWAASDLVLRCVGMRREKLVLRSLKCFVLFLFFPMCPNQAEKCWLTQWEAVSSAGCRRTIFHGGLVLSGLQLFGTKPLAAY